MGLEINKFANLIWKNEKSEWHRDKGPAVIRNDGCIQYCFNNHLHRLDGPAMIWPDGQKFYWIYDKEYTKAEYYAELKKL